MTNTHPGLVKLLGLIPALLPNARLVHVTRAPLATCFTWFSRLGLGETALQVDDIRRRAIRRRRHAARSICR